MERSVTDLCNEADGDARCNGMMNTMEHIFKDLDCSNKQQSNIKNRIISSLNATHVEDKGLILLQYILKQEQEIQKLQLQDSGSSSDFKKYIAEMKQAINSSNKRNVDRYEKVEEDCKKYISELDNQYGEICDLVSDYNEMVGVRVPNFKRALDSNVPETRLIHSKRNYIYVMNILSEDIKKSSGVSTMRLEQFKQEYLKNKELKKFT
jgi:hypothetical protein